MAEDPDECEHVEGAEDEHDVQREAEEYVERGLDGLAPAECVEHPHLRLVDVVLGERWRRRVHVRAGNRLSKVAPEPPVLVHLPDGEALPAHLLTDARLATSQPPQRIARLTRS